MNKTTGSPHMLFHAVLCAVLGAMAPGVALAANPFADAGSPSLLETSGKAVADAQTLEQKPDVYLQLIAGMQQRGLYYASLAHLDAFEARWPGRGDATLLRAHALRESGQMEAAKAMYGKLLDGSFAARAHHGLGLIEMRAGNIEEGSAALDRAAALAPTDAMILGDQGYAYLMLGKLEEARLALLKAAELDDGNKRIGANLALLLALSGKQEQAQELMRRYDLAPRVRADILARAGDVRSGLKITKELAQ